MLYRARRFLSYARFNRACRKILDTAPLPPSGGPIVLSMVSRRDFIPYLVAAKSYFSRARHGQFHVIDDGTLTVEQCAQLKQQGVREITPMSAIAVGPTPRGGCWERLLHIADLNRDSYVVQLDADTLTLAPIPEVTRAIENDASFTLVTHPNTDYCTVSEACAVARADPANDIHTVAEQRLDLACDPQSARYVHGCAAFAGFARASFTRDDVYRFSGALEGALGRRWWEWGSEQVASNFLVSNSRRVASLPYPRYRNFEGLPLVAGTAFAHFIGTYRFVGGEYRRRAVEFINMKGRVALI